MSKLGSSMRRLGLLTLWRPRPPVHRNLPPPYLVEAMQAHAGTGVRLDACRDGADSEEPGIATERPGRHRRPGVSAGLSELLGGEICATGPPLCPGPSAWGEGLGHGVHLPRNSSHGRQAEGAPCHATQPLQTSLLLPTALISSLEENSVLGPAASPTPRCPSAAPARLPPGFDHCSSHYLSLSGQSALRAPLWAGTHTASDQKGHVPGGRKFSTQPSALDRGGLGNALLGEEKAPPAWQGGGTPGGGASLDPHHAFASGGPEAGDSSGGTASASSAHALQAATVPPRRPAAPLGEAGAARGGGGEAGGGVREKEEDQELWSELKSRMGGRRQQQGSSERGGTTPPTTGTAADKRNAGQLIQAILSGQLDEILGEDEDVGAGGGGTAAEDTEVAVPRELQRSLRVGIVGAPNAGKSVLANTLVGAKISAVSHKTNTTRAEAKGVRTEGDTQLVLYDTPGVAYEIASRQLDRITRQATTRAMGVVDVCELLLVVVDAERQIRMPDPRVWRLLQNLGGERRVGQERAVCLNKIDLVADKRQLLPLARAVSELHAIDRIFMISGMKQKGMSALEDYLFAQAVRRPWEEDPTKVTDRSGMTVALDVVREKLFERLHQELPYAIEQRHVSWQELADGSLRIEQSVFVKSDSQRSIVVGKGGKTIRQIGTSARLELEAIFRKVVHLMLDVKVKLDRRR